MTDRPRRRDDYNLSRCSKRALILLEASNGPGVVSADATAMIDGQAWIHWRTAYALHDRGLAEVRGYGEEAEVVLS